MKLIKLQIRNFRGFKELDLDFERFFVASPVERLKLLPAAQEHSLAQDNGRDRFVEAVLKLTKANALCVTLKEAIALENEIAFYQAVKAVLVKGVEKTGKPESELELAVRQSVNTSRRSFCASCSTARSKRTGARTW